MNKNESITAAQAVYEARVKAFGALKRWAPRERFVHEIVDEVLSELEMKYRREADKAAEKKPAGKRKKR